MPDMLIDVKVLSTGGVCKPISLNGDRTVRKAIEVSGIAYDPTKHTVWVSRGTSNFQVPTSDIDTYQLEQDDRVSLLQAMRGNK